jgi:hypothetical protein
VTEGVHHQKPANKQSLEHSTNPQIIEKVKVLLRFLTLQDADPFVWNKYAIVAVVGNDKNGKEELWLAMTSNKAPLLCSFHKLPPAIYLEKLNEKKFKKWIASEPSQR